MYNVRNSPKNPNLTLFFWDSLLFEVKSKLKTAMAMTM